MRPLRIVMAAGLYSPLIGGIERQVQSLAHELSRRGHHVSVVTLRQKDTPPYSDDRRLRVHRIDGWTRALDGFYRNPGRRFHPPAPDPAVSARLAAIVRAERALVHAHNWMV
jgi:glycosyltransferase involved in cell wall biosynthesis